MQKMTSEKLLALLRKPSHLKLEGNTLKLTIENCDKQALLFVRELIKDAETLLQHEHSLEKQQQDADEYQQYFSEIERLPIYKPANPTLAILQVAKKYQLDSSALNKAFKHRG
jgi:hypothetical protein